MKARVAPTVEIPRSTLLDLSDYLEIPSTTLCDEVLQQVYGVHAPAAAAVYAQLIAKLNLGAPQAVMALATVIPATRVSGLLTAVPATTKATSTISAAALRNMLAVSDPSLHYLIERIVQTYDASPPALIDRSHLERDAVRPRRKAGASSEKAQALALGILRLEPDPRVDPACYLTPSFAPTWRSGMASTLADIACIVAMRTAEAGLLLGPGVSFLGRCLDGDMDEYPPGWILFGPKRDLAEGAYRLDVELDLQRSEGLLLDIVSNHGLCKLAELDLSGSTRFSLGFRVGRDDQHIEVRLLNMSGRPLSARIGKLIIRRC